MNHIARKWLNNFRALRSDERGAESSEVILVLVLFVIGLLVAWKFLRKVLSDKASCTGSAIKGANTGTAGVTC